MTTGQKAICQTTTGQKREWGTLLLCRMLMLLPPIHKFATKVNSTCTFKHINLPPVCTLFWPIGFWYINVWETVTASSIRREKLNDLQHSLIKTFIPIWKWRKKLIDNSLFHKLTSNHLFLIFHIKTSVANSTKQTVCFGTIS
jgi:hypothetical protein